MVWLQSSGSSALNVIGQEPERGGSRYSTIIRIIVSTAMSFGLISGATFNSSIDAMTNTAHGPSFSIWVRFGRHSIIRATSLRFSGSELAASTARSTAATFLGCAGIRARTVALSPLESSPVKSGSSSEVLTVQSRPGSHPSHSLDARGWSGHP